MLASVRKQFDLSGAAGEEEGKRQKRRSSSRVGLCTSFCKSVQVCSVCLSALQCATQEYCEVTTHTESQQPCTLLKVLVGTAHQLYWCGSAASGLRLYVLVCPKYLLIWISLMSHQTIIMFAPCSAALDTSPGCHEAKVGCPPSVVSVQVLSVNTCLPSCRKTLQTVTITYACLEVAWFVWQQWR